MDSSKTNKEISAQWLMLDDVLHFNNNDAERTKVRFLQSSAYDNPLDLYKSNPDEINKAWLLWRNKQRYFVEGDLVIGLLKMSGDTWLLTTVARILKDLGATGGVGYEAESLEEWEPLYGRVIVKHRKRHSVMRRKYLAIKDELLVQQVLAAAYERDEFPGYDRVCLSFAQLERIVNSGKRDWTAALEHQKAVYLITNTQNGKLYVGSAYNDGGLLLQRWNSYVKNGHGGNKELKALVRDEGLDYLKEYFQYSILENYNTRVSDAVIRQREQWWKQALGSRVPNGYNAN